MNIKLLLTLAFAMVLSITYAQEVSIQRGEVTSYKKSHFDKVIYADESSFYTFGGVRPNYFAYKSKPDFYIKKYNKQTLALEEEIPFKDYNCSKSGFKYYETVYGKEKAHIFFTCYDRKSKSSSLVVVSVKDGREISPYRKVFKARLDASVSNAPQSMYEISRDIYTINISRDSTKIFVRSSKNPKQGRSQAMYKVFDEDFVDITNEPFKIPELPQAYSYTSTEVGDNGDVYVVGYLNKKKEEKTYFEGLSNEKKANEGDKRPSYTDDYILFNLTAGGKYLQYDLKQHDKIFHDISIIPDIETGTVALVGFYINKGELHAKGVFYILLESKTFEVISEDFHRFDEEIISHLDFSPNTVFKRSLWGLSKDSYSKKLLGFEGFKFKDCIKMTDGSFSLIAEKSIDNYVVLPSKDKAYADRGLAGSLRDGLLIMKVNNEHGIGNQHVFIDKFQEWGSMYNYVPYLSYYLIQSGSTLHFVFNDNAKNKGKRKNREAIYPFGGSLDKDYSVTMASVFENGEVKYEQLFTKEETDNILFVDRCYAIDANTHVLDLNVGSGIKRSFGLLKF